MRRNGIPEGKISIVDAFLRIKAIFQNIFGNAAAGIPVFFLQRGNGLLGPRKEELQNFAVFQQAIASFHQYTMDLPENLTGRP